MDASTAIDQAPRQARQDGGRPVVCVATHEADKYCESFVKAHIDRLPTRVVVLQGRPLGRDAAGRPLLNEHAVFRLLRRGYGQLGGDVAAFQRRAIGRYFRRHRVAAVLAEKGPVAAQLSAVCARLGIPLIAHFHGVDAYGHQFLERYGTSYRRLFQTAAAVVSVSRDMSDQLERLGAASEKIVCVPSGIDLTRFVGGNPAEAGPTFLAVGRFVEKKAPHLTILAFSRVLAACPGARLRMVAEGPLLETCRQIVEGLRLHDAVEFLGPRPHHEVAELMRQSRAFVQHSLRPGSGDSEGTPVGVLEASATGLPVVATRHAGIKEAVIDGQTGLLVEERDVDGMAAAMLRLANNPGEAMEMGRAGRRWMEQQYDIDAQVDTLWRIIAAAITSSGNENVEHPPAPDRRHEPLPTE